MPIKWTGDFSAAEGWRARHGGQLFGGPAGDDRIGFYLKGQVVVLSRLSDFDAAMRRQLAQLVYETSDRIESRARILAPRATGRLQGSISKRLLDPYGLGIVVRATASHASYVEYGSGPRGEVTQEEAPVFWKHKVRGEGKFPNVRKIRTWAAAKGLNPKLAYVIARHIFELGGVRAQPFMLQQYRAEVPRFVAGVQEIIATKAPAAAGMVAA